MRIDLRSLDGKVVVVTGAGRGTGRALALVLAEAGCRLVLFGRDAAALDEVSATITRRGGFRPVTHRCDMAKPDEIERACALVRNEFPRVDVLINNAAAWLAEGFEDSSADAIADAIGSAVTGTVLVTKYLMPALKASDGADIVNLVSTAGLSSGTRGEIQSEPFVAAKHGQAGFSDALRHSLADQGIRVVALYPPDFAGVQPDSAEWDRTPGQRDGRKVMTTRDIVECAMFALTRPRVMTVAGIVLANPR